MIEQIAYLQVMKESTSIDQSTAAALEALVEAIANVSTLDDETIRAIFTSDEFQRIFQSNRASANNIPDFESDDEVIEASALPLSKREHLELIRASIPSHINQESDSEENQSLQQSMIDVESLACVIREIARTSATAPDMSQRPFPLMDELTPAIVSPGTPSAEEQEEAIKRAIGEKLHSYIKMRLGIR